MNQINLQAYFANIKKKTGKTPGDFKELAVQKGFVINGMLKPGVKATEVMRWLKDDFGLARGHALAIFHSFSAAAE